MPISEEIMDILYPDEFGGEELIVAMEQLMYPEAFGLDD